jgi:hypothetical protein
MPISQGGALRVQELFCGRCVLMNSQTSETTMYGWEDRLTREQYRIVRCVLDQYVECIISDGEAYLQLTNNGLTPEVADDILDAFSHV